MAYSDKENTTVKRALPAKEEEFQIALDVADVSDDYLAVEGWTRFTDHSSSSMDTYLFLRNATDTIFIRAIPVERNDVADYFKSTDLRFSGFRVVYPTCKIKAGDYQVGILLDDRGISFAKTSEKTIRITADSIHSPAPCDERAGNIASRDRLSVQDLIIRNAGINVTNPIGFVTDSLPPGAYELKYREVQYSMIPTLVEMSISRDTVLAYFPSTREISNPKNPIHRSTSEWTIIKNFENSLFLLVHNTTAKKE